MNNQLDEIIDFKQFFFKLIKNWFFFLISLFLTFTIAYAYNRYTHELYMIETSILIKEDNTITSASDLLYEKSMKTSGMSLENKELVLKSYPLVYATLEELDFDIVYYIVGNIKVSETFIAPVKIECSDVTKIIGKSIKIESIDSEQYMLIDERNNKYEIHQFGKLVSFYETKIKVELNPRYSVSQSNIPNTVIKFKDLKSLTLAYQNKILISQKDRESTVINISILEEDQMKGIAFLNKLTEIYIDNEINEKNTASKNTVSFINIQLKEMSDSLSLIEQQIQEYKNNNKITDLSLKAQSIYTNIVSVETELANRKSLRNYYTYLENYINNGDNLEGINAPTSFGINDVGLNALISQLVEIQIKKNILLDGGQVNNPAIVQYNRQTKQLVLNLKEAISTSKSANGMIIKDYQNRISKMEASLGDIPKVERELLSIERLQSISENIYIFLLKKRAEAKITSSSNVSDTKVLEPAIFFKKEPVDPDKSKNYTIAFLLGMVLPLVILLLKDLINDKIITRTDLEKASSIPVLGMIGRNYSGHSLLSQQSPKSAVFEGFRAVRSNLNFFNPDSDKKVYLVTSSISGEGKTYIAENLAIVFAKSGKKTLVIGADLRRPKIYADFSLENDLGISNHILGSKSLDEVLLKSDVENLDVLVSGPIPSNPSDALLTDKFKQMLTELKKRYDIIVLDTPPLGLVADALTLMKYSDINLYVVRQDYTQKGLLTYVGDMYEKDRLGDLHLVFNDVKEGSGAYGYGYGYGFGFGYGYGYGNNYEYTQGSEYFDDNEK